MEDINEDEVFVNVVPLEMTSQHSPKSQRSASMTSRFYEAETEDQDVKSFIENTSANDKPKDPDSKIRQSKHLPYWAWYLIAKSYGIPLKPDSKPVLGTILHGLTFAYALTYAMSYTWFVIYDILSPGTPRDIPVGIISILLVYFWCGFGFYCKNLSSRLFVHSRFLKDIRMHTRTVFKINGALVVFVLGLIFTLANVYESLGWFSDKYCKKIELNEIVCQIMSVSSMFFSVFTLIWYSLVSFIFMSICRTHTIGIRRFIKEIEYDASLIEHHLIFTRQILPFNHDNIWHDSKWIVDDEIDEYLNYRIQSRHAMSVSKKDINPRMRASAPNIRNVDQQGEISVLFSPVTNNLGYRDDQSVASDFEWNYNRESRLRFSSYSLQRWYASFMSLVMLRCSTYLVRWLENPATISDLLQFFLPLGMLVILSTSIAEVNFESKRVLRSIYPNEERIRPLQYMNLNPLQLSVYGFGVTHGTIVTVVIAMLVAFVSQVVITEMTQV